MRRFVLGLMILMAVPAYAAGQQRDRSERSATGRTAIPREDAVRAAPARQPDGRPDSRRAKTTPSTREEEKSEDTSPSRADRERLRNTPKYPQGNPWLVLPAGTTLAPLPDREQRRRPGQGDGNDGRRFRRPQTAANVVFVPYAVPVVEREVVIQREVVEQPAVPVIVEPSGARLVLDVHPPTAQVFADGYYIGIPEDFRFEDGGAVLEPGPHRIDIIARDHAPVSFDVNLARGQSATFRHSMTPIVSAPQLAPDVAPERKQPVTFYLIPGCYMGNVPPAEANLPATCDMTRAVSVQY